MRFYSELTYWNTACCKKRKNAFVSPSLRKKCCIKPIQHFLLERQHLRPSQNSAFDHNSFLTTDSFARASSSAGTDLTLWLLIIYSFLRIGLKNDTNFSVYSLNQANISFWFDLSVTSQCLYKSIVDDFLPSSLRHSRGEPIASSA